MDKTYKLTKQQFHAVKRAFYGYIFNRKEGENYIVKVHSAREKKTIESFLKQQQEK